MDTGHLIDAVRTHRVVELRYRGRKGTQTRVVHPHAVYRTSSGNLRVECVQVAGATTSGQLPGWREFELMKIADIRLLDAEFQVASDFNPTSLRYRHGTLAVA
jgi:predicted DNA-binding transcriptional regulator YafY